MLRHTKQVLALLSVLLFAGTNLYAQSAPKYSNEFLSIGVGARAFGMSNSVIASVEDVTAGYWNPSALVKQEDKIQLSFMHSALFSGIANYDYLGISTKVNENAALSFSMIRFGVDGIPNTLDLVRNGQIDYNRVTEFSAVDYAFIVSYAQKAIKNGLSIGGSAKIINRKAGEFTTAWGFGIDASARYQTQNKWIFAAVARDVTTTFNAWKYNFTDAEIQTFQSTGNEVPVNSLEFTLPKLLLGVSKKINFNDDYSLLTELNMDLNTEFWPSPWPTDTTCCPRRPSLPIPTWIRTPIAGRTTFRLTRSASCTISITTPMMSGSCLPISTWSIHHWCITPLFGRMTLTLPTLPLPILKLWQQRRPFQRLYRPKSYL
jgi:hypothetical protein